MTDLDSVYAERRSRFLKPVAARLEHLILDYLGDTPHIDRVSARAKSVERFVAKSRKLNDDGKKKYNDPLNQIQDQVAARIVVFYPCDVEKVEDVVVNYFRPIESKPHIPDSEDKFGYEGKHFILFIPDDVKPLSDVTDNDPKFFELQIKTLFQHAWSEASHDVAYKPTSGELTTGQKRRVAFAAAQAWGGDMIFNDLVEELTSKIDGPVG